MPQGRIGAYRFDDGVGRYPSYASLSTEGYIAQPDSDTCGPTAVRNALTNWNVFRTVDGTKQPTQSLIWDAFTYGIPRKAPLILNVHMVENGAHLYGYYRDAEYWHFVTETGFAGTSAASSATLDYHDPFNRPSRLVGNPYGDHSDTLGKFATMLRDHGLVW